MQQNMCGVLTTVETHTAGEPFRILVGGAPAAPGGRIVDRRAWLRTHADQIRRTLMHEPRGHADMYGGILTVPVSPGADFGVIFLHNEGYSDHCGHGVIALATAAVQLGWVVREIPETRVGIDAPCGFVPVRVGWDGTTTGPATFTNVPSFLAARDVTLQTPTHGTITGDIAYGGAFYFYTEAPAGLTIREADLPRLIAFGAEVKVAANEALAVAHPDIPEINHIYGTIIAGPPRHGTSSQANCCVFADREVDRSPTGSGTAGRVAQLVARGRLTIGEALVNESVIGTVFTARATGRTSVGPHEAVLVDVSGEAHLTGFANWVIDPADALRHGFLPR